MKKKADKEISDRIIREFAEGLRRILGDQVRKIILYGSRARGDFWEGSDYDVVVLVDRRTPDLEEKILDLEGQFMDRYDILISSIVRSEAEWLNEKAYPFVSVVDREGVAI